MLPGVPPTSSAIHSVYIPFDEEQAEPLDANLPPEITSYVTLNQWQDFCNSGSLVMVSIHNEYRLIFWTLGLLICVAAVLIFATGGSLFLSIALLVVGIIVASPFMKTFYVRPRLLKRMTGLCKEVSNTKLPGVIVQFKSDRGTIISSEPAFGTEAVHNYYVDLWLVRPSNP